MVAAAAVVVPLLLLCSSAVRAPLRFVVKAFFFIKSLLALGENKFRIAIFANHCLISHYELPPYIILDINDSLTRISKTIEAYDKNYYYQSEIKRNIAG
jgi:hypothetical protein